MPAESESDGTSVGCMEGVQGGTISSQNKYKPLIKACQRAPRQRLILLEKCFALFGHQNREHVCLIPKIALQEMKLKPIVKHGGVSVTVLGCFDAAGIGQLKIHHGFQHALAGA